MIEKYQKLPRGTKTRSLRSSIYCSHLTQTVCPPRTPHFVLSSFSTLSQAIKKLKKRSKKEQIRQEGKYFEIIKIPQKIPKVSTTNYPYILSLLSLHLTHFQIFHHIIECVEEAESTEDLDLEAVIRQ
jgi:hypothetical protein